MIDCFQSILVGSLLFSLTSITRLKSPAKIISSHAKSCKWSKTYFKKVGVHFCKGEQFFVRFNITKATLFLLANTFSTFCFLNSIPICKFHHPCLKNILLEKYIAISGHKSSSFLKKQFVQLQTILIWTSRPINQQLLVQCFPFLC